MISKKKSIEKESRQNILFSVILGVLILVVVGSLVIANLRINQRRAELQSRVQGLQSQIQALEKEREKLETQISQSTQEEYLEAEARERFNLKKSGEEVVTILPVQKEKAEAKKNFWQEVWEKIKFW